MKKIYKYPLKVDDEQLIELPEGAEILTVQVQRNIVCLWALVNTENPLSARKIFIHGTGHVIADAGRYISTFQLADGDLVFHVFEGQ